MNLRNRMRKLHRELLDDALILKGSKTVGHLECMTAAVQHELLAAAEEIEATLNAPSAVAALHKRAELQITRETHNGSNHNETV